MIAGKRNIGHFGLAVFRNFKRNVHPVFRQADQLGINPNIIKTFGLIQRQNAPRVAFNARLGINHALFNFDFLLQGFVVNFTIVFKVHNIDQRVFNNVNHNGGSTMAYAHIGKQSGLKQRLNRFVDSRRGRFLPLLKL